MLKKKLITCTENGKKLSYSLNVLKMLTDINAYTKLETAELS